MRHRLAFPAFLFALIFLLFSVGCWNPFKPDEKDPGNGNGGGELLERTSPENVLNNLKVIYGQKDDVVNSADDAHYWAEQYRELFDFTPGVFKFYFVEGDEPPDYPQGYWFAEDEVLSFEGLLNSVVSGAVLDIDLGFPIPVSEDDNRVDEHGQKIHPGWKHSHISSINLEVSFSSGLIKQVPGGTADIYFGPDPANSALWVITEWIDRPIPTS